MNKKMRDLLGEYQHDPQSFVTAPPDDLMSELRDGFEEFCGCVLPRVPRGRKPFQLEEDEDETGIECLLSKENLALRKNLAGAPVFLSSWGRARLG